MPAGGPSPEPGDPRPLSGDSWAPGGASRPAARPGWLAAAIPQVMRAAGQGADLFSQASATAAEAVRSRREPSVVAERRRVAARRRCSAWSVASVVLAAVATYGAIGVFSGRGDAADVAALVLAVGLLVLCVLGAVRAAADLRIRTRIGRALPPPQPRRYAVASIIRPQIDRLSDYSDSLRELIGMVGIAPASEVERAQRPARRGSDNPARRANGKYPSTDATIRSLRDDTLAAADDVEVGLRARAAELTALVKAARASGDRRSQAATQRALVAEIAAGVDGYGRLVAAAGQAVVASRQLAGSIPAVDQLADATDRLTALAAGMRELSATDRRPR